LAPEDERIQRLLTICRYELEDLDGMDIGLIDELATAKKWRKALAAARTIKHQSVRMCNIRGCLFAAAGRYDKAARWFAKALTKDSGNITARIYLIEALSRKTRLWIRI
jgi:tetratricopeptide (TPR) repeat protein